ncbi:MAG TPA: hypothetical protein PKK11_08695 [Methanothrix sp.]|nr:hypothetical protein [Methanothrix sp.]HPT19019.1 hypothetical protein [Methanothrix sp.]
MAKDHHGGQAGAAASGPAEAARVVLEMIAPLRAGDLSGKLDKISVYVQSAARARDAKQMSNFIRFAILNLDAALLAALESAVFRPRLASKSDEHRKAAALQKTFDRIDQPASAMLEHYRSSSDPLNKYLVAGPWGHEYLKKRGLDLEEYDRELCSLLGCEESPAGRMMMGYARLRRAVGIVEASWMESSLKGGEQ